MLANWPSLFRLCFDSTSLDLSTSELVGTCRLGFVNGMETSSVLVPSSDALCDGMEN